MPHLSLETFSLSRTGEVWGDGGRGWGCGDKDRALPAQATLTEELSCLQENVCYSFCPDTPGEEHNFFCDWR